MKKNMNIKRNTISLSLAISTLLFSLWGCNNNKTNNADLIMQNESIVSEDGINESNVKNYVYRNCDSIDIISTMARITESSSVNTKKCFKELEYLYLVIENSTALNEKEYRILFSELLRTLDEGETVYSVYSELAGYVYSALNNNGIHDALNNNGKKLVRNK